MKRIPQTERVTIRQFVPVLGVKAVAYAVRCSESTVRRIYAAELAREQAERAHLAELAELTPLADEVEDELEPWERRRLNPDQELPAWAEAALGGER